MHSASTAPKISIKNIPKIGTPTYTFRVDINEEACTGCGKCVVECPSRILDLVVKDTTPLSSPACSVICPVSNDIRAALKAVADQGSFEQAWRIITRTNPMPAVTGRVCHHPCESECNRTHLDAAVNINQFERSVGDFGIEKKIAFDKGKKQRKEKVAVVGAGPSGMSCAYHLARFGYHVTVFDANEKAGGMLRYGLPAYRLPDNVLDGELQRIIDLGIEVRYSTRLGKDIDLGQLRRDFNAVYLALGAQNDISLGLEGEKASNSFSAVDFLRIFAEKKAFHVGSKVTVIGGGNVAVDVARSALRCGAREVTMVCLEQRYEMPAWDREVEETIAEGIRVVNGYGPMEIITKDESITDIVFKRCTSVFDNCGCFCPTYDENDRITIATDSLVVAIGQRPDCSCLAEKDGITVFASGHVEVKDAGNLATSLQGAFAGGDVVLSPGSGTVSGAIGMGHKGALAIDAYLQGKESCPHEFARISTTDIQGDRFYKMLPRNDARALMPVTRLASPETEVNLPLEVSQVVEETKRCFVCGVGKASYTGPQFDEAFNLACHNCHNCVSVCSECAIEFNYCIRTESGDWGGVR